MTKYQTNVPLYLNITRIAPNTLKDAMYEADLKPLLLYSRIANNHSAKTTDKSLVQICTKSGCNAVTWQSRFRKAQQQHVTRLPEPTEKIHNFIQIS